MILNFQVQVEVCDYYGEKYVDYLKHLLMGHLGRVGTMQSIVYEPVASKPDSYYETIERTAHELGETDL